MLERGHGFEIEPINLEYDLPRAAGRRNGFPLSAHGSHAETIARLRMIRELAERRNLHPTNIAARKRGRPLFCNDNRVFRMAVDEVAAEPDPGCYEPRALRDWTCQRSHVRRETRVEGCRLRFWFLEEVTRV